jgi:hypothetical protein
VSAVNVGSLGKPGPSAGGMSLTAVIYVAAGLARLGPSYTMFVLAADDLADLTERSQAQIPLLSSTKRSSKKRVSELEAPAPKPVSMAFPGSPSCYFLPSQTFGRKYPEGEALACLSAGALN